MSIKQMMLMQKKVAKKLMGAIAMLLVSSIMLGTTTYAWRVISTAPEVTKISTTAGSNGCLEITLLGTTTTDTGTYVMSHPAKDSGGHSSANRSVANTESNSYYGNVVDLSTNYGLESIMLTPAVLNLITSDSSVLVNTQYPLKVPRYGTDGRITETINAPKAHYDSESELFEDTAHWGVSVIGFKRELNNTQSQTVVRSVSRESIRAEAAEYVYYYRQQIRSNLIDTLEAASDDIFGVINKTTNILWLPNSYSWDENDEQCVQNITNMLAQVASESDVALRWAFLAYCVSDNVHYDAENEEQMAELGRIYKQFLTMPLIPSVGDTSDFNIKTLATNNGYTTLVTAIDAISEVKTRVAAANTYLEYGQVGPAGACIISITGSYIMNGGTTPQPVFVLNSNGTINTGAQRGYFYNWRTKRTEDTFFFVGSGSVSNDGLFQALARVVGDYTATLKSDFSTRFSGGVKTWTYDLMVTSLNTQSLDRYSETENTGTLGQIYTAVAELETSGTIPLEINRFGISAYGYQIDLALRSSEAGNLILEKEGLDRVLGMTAEDAAEMGQTNAALQGSGSTFTFTRAIDMSDDQVTDLLRCIRIVFMTTDGQIYAVGVPDTPTIKGDTVKGVIRLYNVNQTETATKGTLTLGSEIASNAITTIQKERETDISVIVYLDGEKVMGTYTSAGRGFSLDGSLNLQFGNSTTLTSMKNGEYLNEDSID